MTQSELLCSLDAAAGALVTKLHVGRLSGLLINQVPTQCPEMLQCYCWFRMVQLAQRLWLHSRLTLFTSGCCHCKWPQDVWFWGDYQRATWMTGKIHWGFISWNHGEMGGLCKERCEEGWRGGRLEEEDTRQSRVEKTSRWGSEKVAGITSPLTKGKRRRERDVGLCIQLHYIINHYFWLIVWSHLTLHYLYLTVV